MDTHTFWTTVGLIATALLILAPLAHRALGGPGLERARLHVAGALAVLSFAVDAGVVAAVMTLPWLVLGLLLAWQALRATGVAAVLRHPSAAVHGSLATFTWMAAGGAWLTAHRLGLEPLGFDRAITLLTVAHFHVAGMGLTALLGVTHRRRPSTTSLVVLWLHQAGMLTVAAGLTVSDHLEVVGAATVTLALAIWAAVVVSWIRRDVQGTTRTLLAIAVVAWILPMALALGWALGPFLPEPVVTTFATMLRYHATLQTFGLVLCGLLGLVLAGETSDTVRADPATTHTPKEAHDDVAHQTHP
ncbi:MAG: hypothetical protein RL238_1391 [Actinomycetota bacterium]|jgi:hypothetical protein